MANKRFGESAGVDRSFSRARWAKDVISQLQPPAVNNPDHFLPPTRAGRHVRLVFN